MIPAGHPHDATTDPTGGANGRAAEDPTDEATEVDESLEAMEPDGEPGSD